jgi:hypothetical protein
MTGIVAYTLGGFKKTSSGASIGSTTSTQTPTLTSGVSSGTTNGSPFGSSVNSYQITNGNSPYNYVSVPGGSGFAFGTGDYTVEWFQYETDTNSFPRIFWYGTTATPSLGMSFEGTYPYLWPAVSALGSLGTYKNGWHHFALVRISSKVYLYKDGTLLNTGGTANSTNVTDTTSTWYIGSKAAGGIASEQFSGSITSFRVCKGIGVYTGAFTAPTSKLGQTQSANPYGGSNTSAITSGQCSLLLNP